MKLGKQYSKDDDFKCRARLYQSKYRAEVLNVDCDEFGNMLKKEDGEKGLNFYPEFGVLDAVYERYGRKYNKQLYSNLIRSEHISFNLFIPLSTDLEFMKNVFNEFVSDEIKYINYITIEYTPENAEEYLNDRTSFDVYVEYMHSDNKIGILGIEIKYTEQGYPLKIGSKEHLDLKNPKSKYWVVTRNSGLFNVGVQDKLILDDYRQIWRNQLLGECIKQKGEAYHFTSITMYPKGNLHFSKVIPEYQTFLKEKSSLIGITYEDFIEALTKHSKDNAFDKWIAYLKERYLIDKE